MTFGDSILEGFASPAPGVLELLQPSNAYPAKLGQFLRERFPVQQVVVANRGWGGTSRTGCPGLLADLETVRPDLVLLLEGINDLALGLLVAGIEE